ncbi:hypothetical protein BX616_010560 [Lobosporangium transversale]|uniref:Uncharacterized protein n=1 Tax=Lobosporangium transversale TaxID=64571 RepID=A0A1Y2GX32_9FUNG|nr:hypothetical protein BCR41DRAFT_383938 [Lobosporangium transversale]KAF9911605.1 hypothetical protein BX616_010560 [Lobosporangium transversale]ORZ26860.1 hypothetical protein BCR41DRAFT_383938 [Lobosporangium transversale]|eukprot:XP_021884607.1 hypothetical protein BCR41DRAFT_383938 [Lobosporangium transversale]
MSTLGSDRKNNAKMIRSGYRSSLFLPSLALAMTWMQTISANIAFNKLADNLIIKPGETVALSWTAAAPDAGTVLDDKPFNLVLRALTGQRYLLQSNVAQTALNLRVQIPANATGGKHSFYCDYQSKIKPVSSRQFDIDAPIITITTVAAAAAIPTDADPTIGSGEAQASSGLSGMMLIGLIAGAAVLLLAVSMLFITRHRRRVSAAKVHDGPSMDDSKEAGLTSKEESLTKSAGAGGPADGDMVSVPLNGAPSRPEHQVSGPINLIPQQMSSPSESPFDGPEVVIPAQGALPRQHQYQPPQMTGPPPQRASSPQNRKSSESDAESIYDPNGPKELKASPSNGSSRYPHNMGPQSKNQAPLTPSNEHEILAMNAAAAAAVATSPVQAHRQVGPNATPRVKDLELEQLGIQQHHYEQQQKMLQRQQQEQQQQQVQQQAPSSPEPSSAAQKPLDSTQLDDKAELEEVEDNAPVYNGYRDTIFGAYAQPQDGDEDDEEGASRIPAVPMLSAVIASPLNSDLIPHQPSSTFTPASTEIVRKKSVKFTGVPRSGPIVLPNQEAAKEHQAQRQLQKQQSQEQLGSQSQAKKAKTPKQKRPVSAAAYTENDDDDFPDDDSDSDFDNNDEDDIKNRLMETEVTSPVSSNAPASRPYVNTTATTPAANVLSPVRSSDEQESSFSSLTNVQKNLFDPSTGLDSPTLAEDSMFGDGFYEDVLAAVEGTVPPLNSLPSPTNSSTSPKSPKPLTPKKGPSSPLSSSSITIPAAATASTYIKPALPPVPQSPPPAPTPASAPAQTVQQQYIPAPEPQQLQQPSYSQYSSYQQQPLNEQTFGAPSPRISPATLANVTAASNSMAPYSASTQQSPALSPQSKDRTPGGAPIQQSEDITSFYGGAIL